MSYITPDLRAYIEANKQNLEQLIFDLCAVPAPSNHEELRAAYCKKWLENAGAVGVYIDDAQNVVFPMQDDGGDVLVVMAHTDTVFPDTEPFSVRLEGEYAYCPGIGDDTTNLAILLLLIRYLLEKKCTPAGNVVFVCNSGEEGLGNLRGARQIMKTYAGRVKEFVSLDGGLTGVCNGAVGSTRYKITLKTEGGHSYGSFGNRNAIQRMAALIEKLYAQTVPAVEGARTTYNVGMIEGGTSVNTIAQEVHMLYEYRSNSMECLDIMKASLDKLLDEARADCVSLDCEIIGERPGTGPVDADALDDLTRKATEAIFEGLAAYPFPDSDEMKVHRAKWEEKHPGQPIMEYSAASTDCNIPLSLGVPAVCFGGYEGTGGHTRQEHIYLPSLPAGMAAVGAFLLRYFR